MSKNALFKNRVMSNEHSRLGWTDYLAGNGVPKVYDDSWTQEQQRDYERGRLRAAGAHLIYRKVPKNEPFDIVARTNGLRLVPPGKKSKWRVKKLKEKLKAKKVKVKLKKRALPRSAGPLSGVSRTRIRRPVPVHAKTPSAGGGLRSYPLPRDRQPLRRSK